MRALRPIMTFRVPTMARGMLTRAEFQKWAGSLGGAKRRGFPEEDSGAALEVRSGKVCA